MRQRPRRFARIGGALGIWAWTTFAAGVFATEASLTPLPKPTSLEIPPPTAATLEALDALLARLYSSDAGERENAVAEVLEVERDRLPAIHRRLGSISESSDHVAMKEMLVGIREKIHVEKDKLPPDYLEMVEAHAKPDS